ncbi:hypothetical protein BD779DRAFT_1487780 [Infundibulicybe gibba]|nr:hypothetical protein BD779DRAFT_1487780 [Infundibulicybe gibba]
MGKSNKTLKAALQSQQSRLKAKEKAKHSSQVAEQKQKQRQDGHQDKRRSASSAGPGLRAHHPFPINDRILLIGEGNFSFARALVHEAPLELQYLPAKNVTATAYDTEDECIVGDLREKGVEIIFGVDATRLDKIGALKRRKWDRVVWNFPHAGEVSAVGCSILSLGPIPSYTMPRGRKNRCDDDDDDDDEENEGDRAGQDELNGTNQTQDTEGFDAGLSQRESTQARGTILVTLRNHPTQPRFILLRSYVFYRDAWNGYEHRMTKGERAHGTGRTGEAGEDRTWEFCLRDEI